MCRSHSRQAFARQSCLSDVMPFDFIVEDKEFVIVSYGRKQLAESANTSLDQIV